MHLKLFFLLLQNKNKIKTKQQAKRIGSAFIKMKYYKEKNQPNSGKKDKFDTPILTKAFCPIHYPDLF